MVDDYVAYVKSRITLARKLRVVVDAGNGVAGPVAVRTLEAIGCEVVPLYCEPDGTFPNHMPDPLKPENLRDLIAKVKETGADAGIALDGDGDRLGVVDDQGQILEADRYLILLAAKALREHPGAANRLRREVLDGLDPGDRAHGRPAGDVAYRLSQHHGPPAGGERRAGRGSFPAICSSATR